jgi:hypothetical protein
MTPYLAALDRRRHHRSRPRHHRVARLHRRPESATNNPLKRNAAGAAADLTIGPPPAAAPTRRPEQVSRARDHSEHE